MAMLNPTDISKLRNVLDELSDAQATNAIYFSWGNTQQQIAEMRKVTPVSVRRSLEEARKKLCLSNLDTLRSVVTTRIQMDIWLACYPSSSKKSK
ncbi:sigma-70 family RNA polymerase sigma factor [Rahnella sp. ChDrAdgB13]|uniref:sigma-70 family RNA polymerase sigma factor n=1 Tax=Rahnella sp. ChDrAdgB13 TaxID=1850581 RepID=UPI001AD89723|nr:sigma-70 family RNA polymerase sigma factor [Rahnella sp. ChDrAdgB13]